MDKSWRSVENQIKGVNKGGHFKPKHCISSHKVAIIIPYRDREQHLRIFLKNLHHFLQNQYIEYRIFVVEMGRILLFFRIYFQVKYNNSVCRNPYFFLDI